jgi:hypothetical protein
MGINMKGLDHLNYLPHCDASHASIQHAIKFKLCSESLLSVPRSAVVDGIISYGGSTGIGAVLPRKAYSEFYERNHLFISVPVHSKKLLSSVQPASFRDKLLNICQIEKSQRSKSLDHVFSFTTVYNLFDQQPQDYFFNAISLHGSREDAPYFKFSDSCACAAHVTKKDAIYNSLMEFLERQSLLGSWLSKSYQYAINPSILIELTPYKILIEKLLENGDLYIFSNGNGLPGHTIIMFYFAHSEADIVQYSVGSSSGLNLKDALVSSLEELYQCYTFLYNMESSSGLENKAGSGYHINFQKYNHQNTRKIIPFIQNKISHDICTINDISYFKLFTIDEVLSELSLISNDIYYYHSYEKSLNLHFTKILSPDFFSHMSINESLNFNNSYAKKLGIIEENAYREKIPFP